METPTRGLANALCLACRHNRVDEVKRLLALGVDVLERIPGGPFFRDGLAIHACCYYAHVDCLRCLLATGIEEQLDDGCPGGVESTQEDKDVTPLIVLCLRRPREAELVTDDDDSIDSRTDQHKQAAHSQHCHLRNQQGLPISLLNLLEQMAPIHICLVA